MNGEKKSLLKIEKRLFRSKKENNVFTQVILSHIIKAVGKEE